MVDREPRIHETPRSKLAQVTRWGGLEVFVEFLSSILALVAFVCADYAFTMVAGSFPSEPFSVMFVLRTSVLAWEAF